jgi:NAD(P)H-flavin reductase
LSKSSDTWQQGKGRINREEIRAHLFPFNDFEKENSIVLLCGTDAMVRDTFNPALEEMFDLDFMERNVFVF